MSATGGARADPAQPLGRGAGHARLIRLLDSFVLEAPDRPALDGAEGAAAGTIRVFNAEKGCQERADRDPQCGLGLAIDPMRQYTADNVVLSRVWHGDVLAVDCQLPNGRVVIDEADPQSTRWFHVRLPPSTPPTAWLPVVRTKDRPALQGCAHPATGR
ncbi:hypothetical protein ACWGHI_27635 [Streptomyces sp. NPDC054912]